MARGGSARRGSTAFDCNDDDYNRWRTTALRVDGRTIDIVSKPGVRGFGASDPSLELLLEHVEFAPASTVCALHCGAGAVGALAGLSAPDGHVWMTDPEVQSVEAARRTLAANGVVNAEVVHGRGADDLRGDAGMSIPPIDIVVIRLPKGKLPILQLLNDAYQLLRPGGRCFIAGGNDEGIRSAFRLMEQLFGKAAVLAYGGGHRICVATRPDAPADRSADFDVPWLDADCFHQFRVDTRGGPIEVFSRPGVFSWDRLDRGTAALLDTIDIVGARNVLDLGCGSGIVGVAAARLGHDARVTMVDANIEAVRSSRRTVEANGLGDRCDVLASDVAVDIPSGSIDIVVTNPPFHTGKATDLDVPAQFIRDAARVLTPGGRLFLVANRTLPYEAWMRRCFGSVSTLVDGREFKVLSAVRSP